MKKLFLLLFLLGFTTTFAQEKDYEVEEKVTFQPMFSVGSGYYNSLGDIKGPEGNYLLGNMGLSTGIRINLNENVDMSFLFTSNAKLHEKDLDNNYFETDLNSLGFNFDYTFHNILSNTRLSPYATFGAQWMYFKTTTNEITKAVQESGMNIPLGIGISLDVSERIRFDIGMNYHLAFSDIDHATDLLNNDNFTVVGFTMHYDLFTPKPQEINYYDESYYVDVNFKALDIEDSDGDLVPDIDDYCPETPEGVKVNEFGCPLDDDNDGIPNWLDEQENTDFGAVVDERGVQLTEEQFKSMYSEYEAASREYANFYNESEIQRENFKTVNEYLIAKANAFNQAYNDESGLNAITGKLYKVQLGRYSDDIPSYLINKFLSYEDLESIPQLDGTIIYAVGSYENINDAENRQMNIEISDRIAETIIIIDENGIVSNYAPPILEEEEIEVTNEVEIDSTSINNSTTNDEVKEETIAANKDKVIYRVQVGYYEEKLSSNIFEGVNVIPIRKGNGTFYMVGAFTEHQDALIKQSEMKTRGFSDAFIVTYKNGERINVSTAIKTERKNKRKKIIKEERNPTINLKFFVQIGVWGNTVDGKTMSKLEKIGGAEKIHIKANLYKYIAGSYNSLEEAELRKSEAVDGGFDDSFIYAEHNRERIKLKDAKLLSQ